MRYIVLFLLFVFSSCSSFNSELTMVVGTYTSRGSVGIYSYRFNQDDGNFLLLSQVETSNPSFLAFSEDGDHLYSVNENAGESAMVSAFKFDIQTGRMDFINSMPTNGDSPCYIAFTEAGITTANYTGGSLSLLGVAKSDGSLTDKLEVISFNETDVHSKGRSHLHCVVLSPDKSQLFATDLGRDKIYQFDMSKGLDTAYMKTYALERGSGPRHIAFSPNGKFMYTINELSGTVNGFKYTESTLQKIQVIASDSLGGNGSADIHFSPDGRFLYASNRLKADGISIFKVEETGILSKIGYADTDKHPRNFIITPNGKYLLVASRDDDNISIFERDIRTGLLTDTRRKIILSQPVCIKFWANS